MTNINANYEDHTYRVYKEDVFSLRCLAYAYRSHQSRPVGGRWYKGPVTREAWAECVKWIAQMAAPAALQVNNYYSKGDSHEA